MIMFAIAEKSPKIWHEQQMKISSYIQVLYNFASKSIANEEATVELDLQVVEDNQGNLFEPEVDGAGFTIEDREPVVVDLDQEEDDDWDKLEAASVITPCVGHDKETERLEEIREELNNESISFGEIVELQELSEFIEEGDVQLLEAAGVPEFPVDEMERVDDFILTQNEVKEANFAPVLDEPSDFFTDESAEELIDDIILPTVMSDEQIELVKEEHGIIEKGNPDDGFIGSTVIEEDANSLFDLIDDEDDESADEVPWFTNENAEVKEVNLLTGISRLIETLSPTFKPILNTIFPPSIGKSPLPIAPPSDLRTL